MTTLQADQTFFSQLEEAFRQSNLEFARAYYLFATAKLSEKYNSEEIYQRYPLLTEEETFHKIKALYDADASNEELKRLFTSVLGTYIGNQLCALSDEIENLKNQLKIPVAGLGIRDGEGREIEELLYEDVAEWLKKLEDKPTREALYQRMSEGHGKTVAPKFIQYLEREIALFQELGYGDLVRFYSQTSGHDLPKLGEKGKYLVEQTESLYRDRVAAQYRKRTGEDFSQAVRADISYVFHGKDPEMASIDKRFPKENLVPLAQKTFDGLGLAFSQVAHIVDYPSMADYDTEVVHNPKPEAPKILLDIAHRPGKRSRAYVYPARVPSEIYLSVKPEGGLDDYSAFFHESGHAQHFAYESPDLSYAMALMGNNTVTEAYAYLSQNLFLNRHWLERMVGLSADEARQVVRRGALNDLYMLRRYASKLQFELKLFDGTGLAGKDKIYGDLLTHGTGFRYEPEGWTRDVDAGFYVADYFTAWALEAQLREYLCQHFGNPSAQGEDWYRNPEAGAFLKSLWRDGNLTQQDLSARLGYNDPTEVGPLLRLMRYNLE